MKQLLSNPLVFGIAAGVLTSVSMLPQLYKIIKKKKAEDVSVLMLIVLMLGVATWVYYGALIKDAPLIITNAFSFLVNLAILLFSIKYKKKHG